MDHREALLQIHAILQEKGYRPVDQIIGYILTEDPTYITNYKGARQLANSLDRDELLKDILSYYFAHQSTELSGVR